MNENSVNRFIRVESGNHFMEPILRSVLRQFNLNGVHAKLLALALLGADISSRSRIVPDENHSKTRQMSGGFEFLKRSETLSIDSFCDRFAFNQFHARDSG